MPDVRTIRVFIASPGDLAVERRAFKDVIEELNNGFGDDAGVKFEALGWEDTLASTGRQSQGVINREIDRCDACRLGLRPDRPAANQVGTESQPTRKRCTDPGPQLQKVLDFRKSLEESRQVLSHGFANEAEFKAEVDRHLRAFAKGGVAAGQRSARQGALAARGPRRSAEGEGREGTSLGPCRA